QWREQSARALAQQKAAHAQTEAALQAARSPAAIPADDAAARRLRLDLERLQNALAEREAAIAQAKAATSSAQKEARRDKEQSARERKEFALKLQQIEEKLAEAQAEAKSSRERHDTAKTKRLRDDLTAVQASLSERDLQLTQAQTETAQERRRAGELQSTLAKAEESWKAREASRSSASKAEWEEKWRLESDRAIGDLAAKLRRSELALKDARAETKLGQERRDAAEMHRLADEVRTLKSTVEKRDLELSEARADSDQIHDRAKRDFDIAHAKSKKEWESAEAARFAEAKAEWERQSTRVFKKATIRLEAAEAALAEARAEASTARDRRDGAEFRRLRGEFAAVSAKLTDCEAQL